MKENEAFLIKQVQKGHSHAFAPLVRQYQTMVFGVAIKVLENREEAEDLAQEIFVKLFRVIHQFNGESKFSTWLYRVAYHTALDAKKKRKRRIIREEKAIYQQEHYSVQDHEKESSYKLEILKNALEKLSDKEQILIDLFYTQECTVKEIAGIMKLSESNIKVKLHRIRKHLYQLLEKHETEIL